MKLLLLSPALLITACTGLPRGWQDAKSAASNDPVSGAWIGTWRSDTNGHSGGLRAVATKQAGDVWQFRYRASWAKVLCAGFTMDAKVQPAGKGAWKVTGGKDLGGALGGTFTCNGTVRGGEFKARYDSRMDRGVMEMRKAAAGD